jgi:predicted Rossmann fold nucleotide-binding protein DprA/Smf involved in DNA uptake
VVDPHRLTPRLGTSPIRRFAAHSYDGRIGRSHDSLATVLLTQRLISAPVAALTPKEYWTLRAVMNPGALLENASSAAVGSSIDASLAERVEQLLALQAPVIEELERLSEARIHVITAEDPEFPPSLTRLQEATPPLLFVLGDPALLNTRMLGIVGSRDVDNVGAEVAREAARHAVASDAGVVTGGAKGVDQLAMQAALEAGGRVACVLADSMTRAAKDPMITNAIDAELLCLATPFKPTAGFSVANAMGRNKIIYALSVVTLVVATADGSGGTWAGATEALRSKVVPVAVWTGNGKGPGNDALIGKGAAPVDDMRFILSLPTPESADSDRPAQLDLGL